MYKIVCIAQIYNELRKGNLERFVKYLMPLVDTLVVYEDGSTDGSYEFINKHTQYVIRGIRNDFQSEVAHRKLLIDEAKNLSPDFLLWLDADEVMTANAGTRLQELCQYCVERNLDGIGFHELNLWRSHTWRRLDSLFDDGWFPRLWRVNAGIGNYKIIKNGLHQKSLIPPSIRKIENIDDVGVLHYGFSSERNLAHKYLTYKAHGQKGYVMLDRLIDEKILHLTRIPKELFPTELWIENDPKPEPYTFVQSLRYVEKYRNEVRKPAFSIICPLRISGKRMRFVYEQVIKYTDLSNAEFFFVVNDIEKETVCYLKEKYIPHIVYKTVEDQNREEYIHNIYRAYDYGAQKARGDFLVFIDSDMAFTRGWMDDLWGAYNGENCTSSRLVEAGVFNTRPYSIQKDFGDFPEKYNEKAFRDFAEKIKESDRKDSALYVPLLIKKEVFIKAGGFSMGIDRPEYTFINPVIAEKSEPILSEEEGLLQRLQKNNISHQTVFHSIVYHSPVDGSIESFEQAQKENLPLVAICNNIVSGTLGEGTIWNHLLDSLPSVIGIDNEKVKGKGDFAIRALTFIKKNIPDLPIIIQNATLMGIIDPDRYTIMILQDNLRVTGRRMEQQETNLKLAKKIVTDSLTTAVSYPEFDCEIIPISADDAIRETMDHWIRLVTCAAYERMIETAGSFKSKKLERLTKQIEYRRWKYPIRTKVSEVIEQISIITYQYLRKIYIIRLAKKMVSKMIGKFSGSG